VGGGVEGGQHIARPLGVEAEVGVFLEVVGLSAGRVGGVARVQGIEEWVWRAGVVEQRQPEPLVGAGMVLRRHDSGEHVVAPCAVADRLEPQGLAAVVGGKFDRGRLGTVRGDAGHERPLAAVVEEAPHRPGRYDSEGSTSPPNHR
jgi:hypothetical protein